MEYSGAGDVFITKLTNNLGLCNKYYISVETVLTVANGILVDASNNVYITGQTFSYNGTDRKEIRN